MKPEWISQYEKKVLKGDVEMPGTCSFSEELGAAMGFAFNDIDNRLKDGFKPVIFVMSVRNVDFFQGFCMNTSHYASYPAEAEVLMTEGMTVEVLAVQEVRIENAHPSFKQYNGHDVTIIHMNH